MQYAAKYMSWYVLSGDSNKPTPETIAEAKLYISISR